MPTIPVDDTEIQDTMLSGFELALVQFTFSFPTSDVISPSFWETGAGQYTNVVAPVGDPPNDRQPYDTYSVVSATIAQNFRDALAEWDKLIAPNFTELADDASGHGEVRIAFTADQMQPNTAGYAKSGSNQVPTSKVGDIWLNAAYTGISYDSGSEGFVTLLHEIGHVLGLQHPHDDPEDPNDTAISAPYDDMRYTVMSYNQPKALVFSGGSGGEEPVNALTPGVLDIAAVQDIYGADLTTATGNDTYSFGQTLLVTMTIYDAGGTDTIDISTVTRDSIVDLTPGAVSSIGLWTEAEQIAFYAATTLFSESELTDFYAFDNYYEWEDNLGIARNTTIENLIAGSGNDTITGNDAANLINLRMGGNDIVNSGDGSDTIYYGATFDTDDETDGGASARDVVVLQGNYTLTLDALSLVGVEYLSLQSGAVTRWGDTANNFYDYDITTDEANVLAGQLLVVNGQSLRAGEDLTFDGSGENDGRFLVYAGHGVDELVGGAGNDVFYFEGARGGAGDEVDGGAGSDAVIISAGNGLTHIGFGETSLINMEAVSVNNRYASDPTQTPSYELVMANGNVAAGQTLIVNGSSLLAPQTVSVDARAETDGRYRMFGGAGDDAFIGGANDDELMGMGGADTFTYLSSADSKVALPDEILDFEVGTDTIDLAAIDANTLAGSDQAFVFIGSTAFAATGAASAGELRAELVGGVWQVSGDTNGDGSADFMILVTATTADPITGSDFTL
jgi:Ca2+-binding RTX toxin-like protein